MEAWLFINLSPVILLKVSERFFRSLLCLLALNLAGCTLFGPAPSHKFILYPVQQGDSLYSVASRFKVTQSELISVNTLSRSEAIKVGQVLRVPYRGQSLARTQRDRGHQLSGLAQARATKPNADSLQSVKLSKAARYIGKLLWPVSGSGGRLGSKFGRRWTSFHEGIDIAAPDGLAVYAAHSGQVVYSGNGLRGYGNLVVVKGDGLLTVYGHNRTNNVRVGQNVKQGQTISALGSTGHSSGPHLHFETRVRNDQNKYAAVDPLVFFQRK